MDDPHKVFRSGADTCAVKPVSQDWLVQSLDDCNRPPVPSRRILVVDDDPSFRYLVRHLFPGVPLDFIEAGDGVEGLEAARTSHPELIFLDLMMPRMNGFEMLAQLRSDPETREIAVIVSSSRVLSHSECLQLEGLGATILSKDEFATGEALPAVRDILAGIGLSGLGGT